MLLVGCIPNSPYPESESRKNIFFGAFSEPPKHMDPATAYSSDEYQFICQIYEPPLQYHFLKRPYTLIPLTAVDIPRPQKKTVTTKDGKKVTRIVYEIRIRPGIYYADHPCFDKRNFHLTEKDVEGISSPFELPHKKTRELVAADYVYQIKRLADPRTQCPILSTMENYIVGLSEYSKQLVEDLEKERKRRQEAAGPFYNQEQDELEHPIVLDLEAHPLPGVEVVDRYTYRIILSRPFPQIKYWLAMPFFSPMPKEAIEFYAQGPLKKKNITIDRFPVGTGPFYMSKFVPEQEIVLKRNPRFHEEYYPSEGAPGDEEAGLLADRGRRLPFLDGAVYKLEKETIPYWNKFLQGYYDTSGIPSDSFEQAVQITPGTGVRLTPFLRRKGIRLLTSRQTTIYYLGFNMLDPVVGNGSKKHPLSDEQKEKNRKLRLAINIAIDYGEYIQIFMNGRGEEAQGPLPPGIFGYEEGKAGINPYVFDWDPNLKAPVRKPIKEAKRLLAEAGYPGGRTPSGEQLTIYFDNMLTGPDAKARLDWFRKQFAKIGIRMESRSTDYNRFREKLLNGNFQMFPWGWGADYPDPQNFLFLLYGPNSKVLHHAENAANYQNDEFDALYVKMATMEDSPQRLKIIRKMLDIVRRDSPWVWGFVPVGYGLYHQWLFNAKVNSFANNRLKYRRIDPELRARLQREWNQPRIWPVVTFLAFLTMITLPVILNKRASRGKQ